MSNLKAYIIRRLLLLLPVLFGVTLLIFAVLQLFDPVERASLYVTSERQLADIKAIIDRYGLNDPVHVQYLRWLTEVLTGNFGWSKVVNMPVKDALIQFLPATIELTLYTTPLILLIGIFLGVKAAVHRDRTIDHGTRVFAIIGWSLPSFLLGIILLAVFYGFFTGLFPPEQLGIEADIYVHSANFIRYTKLNTIDALLNGQLWIFVDALRHLVLPVTSLTILNVALLIRITRSSMLESLGKAYVVMAKAKGLDTKTVVNKHAMRNALIPVTTLSGLLVAGLLNGVVITETIFNVKGIGWWGVTAAQQLDIPAVLGFTLLVGMIYVLANLVVDLLYAYIDPRIRLG